MPAASVAGARQAVPRNYLPWLFGSAVMLSLIALSISGYLSYVAFTSSKILGCGSGGTFDCEHVLHSRWSTMLGLPVAAWASSLYLSVLAALIATARTAVSSRPSMVRSWSWALVTAAGASAGLAALWFTGLQVFALKHLCPWCLGAHSCGLLLCIATLSLSPLTSRIKLGCFALGALGAAAMVTIQLLTPPPLTYKIEEFPNPTLESPNGDTLQSPDAEMFNAPGDGDLFSAPVSNNESLPPNLIQRADFELAQAAVALFFHAPAFLTSQVAAAPANTQKASTDKANPPEKVEGDKATPTEPEKPTESTKPLEKPGRKIQLASTGFSIRTSEWPIVGSPDAKHIFVELFDYTCPHCRATQKAIQGARKELGADLAIITLPVPLNQKCNNTVQNQHPSHRESCEISQIAIACWRCDPEKFVELHEWLLAQNPIPSAATAKNKAVALIGQAELEKEMAQPTASLFISKHVEMYRRMGAGPVPKLVFSNTTLTGELTSSTVLIDMIRKNAK